VCSDEASLLCVLFSSIPNIFSSIGDLLCATLLQVLELPLSPCLSFTNSSIRLASLGLSPSQPAEPTLLGLRSLLVCLVPQLGSLALSVITDVAVDMLCRVASLVEAVLSRTLGAVDGLLGTVEQAFSVGLLDGTLSLIDLPACLTRDVTDGLVGTLCAVLDRVI
jgi:hypothetical protein